MTLIEVIRESGFENKEVNIVYRTFAPIWDNKTMDIFSGYCHWDGEFLSPLDNDYYDLEDTIDKYEIDDGKLIVWYRSQYWEDGEWKDYPFPGEE